MIMDLSILIVTYNSERYIGQLLNHLKREIRDLSAEVIVVDNQSRDNTTDIVATEHPWARLIASSVNLGFAAGNNLAARHATGRFLLLLNPDAVPDTGSLKRGIDLMKAHPSVGLSGGLLYDAQGVFQPSARMFPRLRDELFNHSGLTARFPTNRFLLISIEAGRSQSNQHQSTGYPGHLYSFPRPCFVASKDLMSASLCTTKR